MIAILLYYGVPSARHHRHPLGRIPRLALLRQEVLRDNDNDS